jgi:uncharacterized OB-fold protein
MLITKTDIAAIPRRDLPAINERNRFFWQSGRDGKLRFSRCNACGYYIHPSAPVCAKCRSRDVGPTVVSGRAEVATFTINRQAWQEGLEDPFVVAVVEIEEQEGLRLTTNVVNCGIDEVYIGMEVQVVFDHREDVWLPLFEPVMKGDN